MLGETEKEAVEKGIKTLWLIWAVGMLGLFAYLSIIYTLGEEITPTGKDLPLELLGNIFYGVSVIVLYLGHFIRTRITKDTSFSAQLFKNKTQLNQPLFLAKYNMAVVVSWAMAESVAIFGLVLFFIGADYQTFYILLAISALAMVFFRPKRAELEELASADQPKPAF
jgi:hypothetical protein